MFKEVSQVVETCPKTCFYILDGTLPKSAIPPASVPINEADWTLKDRLKTRVYRPLQVETPVFRESGPSSCRCTKLPVSCVDCSHVGTKET